MVRFREARMKKGIKVTDAAELIGVAQPTLSAWEGGRKEPNIATIKKMAQMYEVSIEYLLGFDSYERLSRTEKIPTQALGLFHGKPVWIQNKGWALVCSSDRTLLFVDGSREDITEQTEIYFSPNIIADVRSERPLSYDEICVAGSVWVEPISEDEKLRKFLRGRYTVIGEFVENMRGNRFSLDSYGAMWLGYRE